MLLFLFAGFITEGQVMTNRAHLLRFAAQKAEEYQRKKTQASDVARQQKLPMRYTKEGITYELQYIDALGHPEYYITNNAVSAATISTDKVYSGGSRGLSLDGTGIIIREWDAGSVRSTHYEFGSRVTNVDGASVSGHSTHVAGTLIAAGDSAQAKGMAYAASLKSYDWNNDVSEMAQQAADGMQISNHSYSYYRGWQGTTWWGDTTISTQEDYKFGFYDENARDWDDVAYNAPYYLIVKAASNDRDDTGDGTYPPDGPYDCIPQKGVAKNILTVGAVNDIPGGYTQPSDVVMTSFSSWGPADDGRIKPDLCANGSGLFSTYSTNDSAYASLSGTSMATPSVAGSLALLIQHYENTHGNGAKMTAATMKALLIHTASEAGSDDGPDYSFGWGLMNTDSAAAVISEDTVTDLMGEFLLSEGQTFTRTVTAKGQEPLKATVVWTDPPGIPPEPAVDPPDTILVNDLDLLVSDGTNSYYPWKLDKDNPSDAATDTSQNDVDNVEVVEIANPAADGTYTITVDHDGSLQYGHQAFSMIVTGIKTDSLLQCDFGTDNPTPGKYQKVLLHDNSVNFPASWKWSITPQTFNFADGTSDTSQNPEVEFTETGSYTVSLTVTNDKGSCTKTKNNYISVQEETSGYCNAWSDYAWGYITHVVLDTIDNVSGSDTLFLNSDTLFYGDYTQYSTGLYVDSSYSVSITCSETEADIDMNVWIDWTRDGDFDDSNEEVVCSVNNGGGTQSFSFTVPQNADRGKTRMRIRTKYYYDDCGDPCHGWYYGEVEDYSVIIYPSSAIWTGTVSTDWNSVSNWSNGKVPTRAYNVTIPASPAGGRFPEVQTGDTAYCQNLYFETGAQLTVNGTLIIGGTINGHNGSTSFLKSTPLKPR